ncbi:hypothetical protein PAMP_005215 [Pampus punctatissimus]
MRSLVLASTVQRTVVSRVTAASRCSDGQSHRQRVGSSSLCYGPAAAAAAASGTFWLKPGRRWCDEPRGGSAALSRSGTTPWSHDGTFHPAVTLSDLSSGPSISRMQQRHR